MAWWMRVARPSRLLVRSSGRLHFSASATTAEPSETGDDILPLLPSAKPPAAEDALTAEALTPAKVVALLDRHIVGQTGAKRAVAVALRNRWRRHRIPSQYREEILPKNILMIGPTGCGKTEIARRLAKMADAPFIKVEATKFTEVGFHGRDVDQIIRDLVENAILLQREKVRAKISKDVREIVEDKILDGLIGIQLAVEEDDADSNSLETLRNLYRKGEIDNRKVLMDVPEGSGGRVRVPIDVLGSGLPVNDLIFKIEKALKSSRIERREVTVAEARQMLTDLELEKHLQSDQIMKDAIRATESDGIVFIDEIDKIVTTSEARVGADASAEGVQRDLLPIIEGSVVNTRHGNVNTDHILFICSGAFHACKPSDMLAELQGRLPIRVELKGLTREDLYRILTEPEINMIRQQQLLMATENVELVFSDGAIKELANVAAEVNLSLDNIGARRLHTVIEKVVEDISFNAPERAGQTYNIDKQKVRDAVGELLKKTDLSKFVL